MTAQTIDTPAAISVPSPDRRWKRGLTAKRIQDFFADAVLQPRIWRSAYPGIMHGLIFWGVTIQILGTIINLMQMQLFVPFVELQFPRDSGYLIYELVMDIAGVAIFLGVFMALLRRLVLRPKTLETRWDDWYALIILFLVPFLGFTTEGLRIVSVTPEWSVWSPVGSAVAAFMRATGLEPQMAQAAHDLLFWVHMGAGLVFVASIPFTKLRHLILVPLNIVTRPLRKESAFDKIENIEEAEILGVGEVQQFQSWQLLSFDACVQCGRCEERCPASLSGMPFSPRAFVRSLRSEMVDSLTNGNHRETALLESLGEDAPWYCTTCGACVMNCPAFVNPPAAIVELRRYQSLTMGNAPRSVASAMRNLERQGNPWGMPAPDRMKWTEGLDVRIAEPGKPVDVLLFMGCAYAYDDRNKKVAKSLIDLLNAAGIDYGILGEAEACCGETARRLGYEYNFQLLAEQNVEVLSEYSFKRIVTPCPHCMNTLRNEYSQFGGSWTVQHTTELLNELPHLPGEAAEVGKVTLHDSCYLARYNGVYDQPRDLIDRAGVERVEMARQGSSSFCCGGGGGQMWMETDAETRINNRRLGDALETGAEIVATACPYCLIMFDDAIRSTGSGERMQVMDLAEILAARLEVTEAE